MVDGSSTREFKLSIVFIAIILGINAYVFAQDIRQTLIITGIFFAISFAMLLGLYLYEIVTKKAILDDNGNIGDEILTKTVLGKVLYSEIHNSSNQYIVSSQAYDCLLGNDIDKITSIYGAISDLSKFEKAVEKVDRDTNFRKILELKYSQISSKSFRDEFRHSLVRYAKIEPSKMTKENIDDGYDIRTGYNAKDDFRELKIKMEKSTFFSEVAKQIVIETLEPEVAKELTAE